MGEAASGGASGVSVSALPAERYWCCYAWPTGRNSSGRRAFYVNQLGEIVTCLNNTAQYSGVANPPAGTATALASVSSPMMSSTSASNATGQDGEYWLVVK